MTPHSLIAVGLSFCALGFTACQNTPRPAYTDPEPRGPIVSPSAVVQSGPVAPVAIDAVDAEPAASEAPVSAPVAVASPPITFAPPPTPVEPAAPLQFSFEVQRQGATANIRWTLPEVPGGYRAIELMRNTQITPAGRARVAAVRATTTGYRDLLPDVLANYWYWLKLTAADGSVVNHGPYPAPSDN